MEEFKEIINIPITFTCGLYSLDWALNKKKKKKAFSKSCYRVAQDEHDSGSNFAHVPSYKVPREV